MTGKQNLAEMIAKLEAMMAVDKAIAMADPEKFYQDSNDNLRKAYERLSQANRTLEEVYFCLTEVDWNSNPAKYESIESILMRRSDKARDTLYEYLHGNSSTP